MIPPGTIIVQSHKPRLEFYIKRATGKIEKHVVYVYDQEAEFEVAELLEGDVIVDIVD